VRVGEALAETSDVSPGSAIQAAIAALTPNAATTTATVREDDACRCGHGRSALILT
jgi:hypothetical protein